MDKKELTYEEKQILGAYVAQICSQYPSCVKVVIDAATEGVRAFASKQNDHSSRMSFMMTQILTECPQGKFGPFSRTEILEAIAPWFEGTTWYKEQTQSK